MYIFSTRFIYIVFLLGLVATNLMIWFEVIDHYSFICLQLNMNNDNSYLAVFMTIYDLW